MSTIKNYLDLGKYKETLLLVFGGAAGGALLTHPFNFIYFYSILFLFFAVMGTNSITNYIDRDIDAIMERTKNRPIPSKRIYPPEKAIYFGVVLIIIGVVGFLYFSLFYSILWLIFGIIFDPILYNYLTKRKTPWNIIIGSFAGGAPVMVIWSAMTKSFFSLTPFILMLTIVVWTPIHIWSLAIRYSSDYKRANVPMLPVKKGIKFTIRIIAISTILLMIFSLYIFYVLSIYLFFIMLIVNILILYLVIKLLIKPNEKLSFIIFKTTSPYLALLFLLIILKQII
ncbi:MAG: heme o synthase [Thermoplasmata archaeon]|nr:heme o synthase [Thermoplasmata archaeon]